MAILYEISAVRGVRLEVIDTLSGGGCEEFQR